MVYRVEECPDSVVVLSFTGRITVENGDSAFIEAIDAALTPKPRLLLVDFAEVTTIDSCGLGELVAGYLRAQRAGCRLQVVRPNARVLEMLRVTRLAPILVEHRPLTTITAAIA